MNVLLILPAAENIDGIYERELSARFPTLNVNCVDHHQKAGAYIESADVIMSFSPFMTDKVVGDAKRLKWIQILGSGVDGVVSLPSLRSDIVITSGRGVQATPVSECALSLMFALSRDMPLMIKNQAVHKWSRWPSQVLHGRTVGIVGVGQIGEALAVKARALGMHVVGISSTLRAVEGFDRMYSRAQLSAAVREVDYLVLLTPHSDETHHLINADILRCMKPSAYLINVARGGVVNERDLIDALRKNTIRGAALDVFENEPLATESGLWDLPNVIVSPHLGGLNTSYPESILPLLERNVSRFMAGKLGEMENVVQR